MYNVRMGEKAKSNHKKHGVTFEEGKTAFLTSRLLFILTLSIQKMKIALSCLGLAIYLIK